MIRHGEKPPDFGNGVDEQGNVDDYSLAVRGWTRAGAIISFFSHDHDKIVRPEMIYAAKPNAKPPSPHGRRPSQTVTPLAQSQNIPFNFDIEVGKEPDLVTAVRSETRTTLISWEHKAIKGIVDKLLITGFATDFPERFDVVWIFEKAGATYAFTEVSQSLLVNDAGIASYG